MLCSLGKAVEEALELRGVGELWLKAQVLAAWPHVVGLRFADKSEPLVDRSALHENGLLMVAAASSSLIHALSLIDIAGGINERLGRDLVQKVRFELREVPR